ncbi:MAG TPA: DinB family protein [Phycisphaerales bacterium]|jgi:uncharacterized damage-inducible protein DinB|nr:DinB family protein [Phycisphaerales bacterium]
MQFSLARITDVLERTPRVLDALLRGQAPEWMRGDYGPGTWSAYEVVGHLIVAEKDDWIPRVRMILEHGESRPLDPFPHDAAIHPSSGRGLDDLLDEFAARRRESLGALRGFGLTEADFQRRGRHPGLGPVTLAQLLSTWAVHDLHHARQIGRAMAYQARGLVGPWRAYLNTLPPADE